MNNVQKINYGPLGANLRIIIDDEQKIWFVASDIAKILEYKDATHMIRGLDKGAAASPHPLGCG